MSDTRDLTRLQLLELSVEAAVDIRTLRKALKNEPIRGCAGDRARRVLEAHGFIDSPQRQRATG